MKSRTVKDYITGCYFDKLGAKSNSFMGLHLYLPPFWLQFPFPSRLQYLISITCQPIILFLILTLSNFIRLQKVSFVPSSSCSQAFPIHGTDMATTAAAFTPATITGAVVNFGSNIPRRTNKVVYIGGMSSYGGLKAHNSVLSLNTPVSTEQCFSKVVSSLRAASNRKGGGGGALFSKCSDVGEIFRIAAIMNGLVLVGVAVGFVLLRVEAWIEENE